MATTVTLKPNAIDISGSTSGTTTLQATAVAGTTTLTLPAATDTLVGRATTDTLTNKTLTGAAMNGTVGATTPSTGTFTSLDVKPTNDGGLGIDIYRGNSGGFLNSWARITDASGVMSFQQIDTSSSAGFNWKLSSNSGSSFTTPMTLDASGNLGIGTTSPASRLEIKDTTNNTALTVTSSFEASLQLVNGGGSEVSVINAGGSNILSLRTGNSEKARIDSSGSLIAGTSSSSGAATSNNYFTLKGNTDTSATDYTAYMLYSNGTTVFGLRNDGALRADAVYNKTSGSGANVFVDSSGLLYRSTSSLKYKQDVQDATHGLAEVLTLRPVTYKGKSENDGDKVFGGLIAEEVDAAGLTEFVQYAEDGTPDALNYGNMASLCIKAIQEMKAIIDTQALTITTLTARITALEGA